MNPPSGSTKHHQNYRVEPKDSLKTAVHGIFAGNSYPSRGNDTLYEACNDKLYEAYNELHSLAQDSHKPFDAPAIVVVGHQTDGKKFFLTIATYFACCLRVATQNSLQASILVLGA